MSIEKRNPGGGLKIYFFKPSPFITLSSCLKLLEAFGSSTGMISDAPQSLIESNMIWTSSYLFASITKKIRDWGCYAASWEFWMHLIHELRWKNYSSLQSGLHGWPGIVPGYVDGWLDIAFFILWFLMLWKSNMCQIPDRRSMGRADFQQRRV